MKIPRVLLVVKRSTFSLLQGESRQVDHRMRQLLREGHASMKSIRLAHEEHLESVRQVRRELRNRGIEFVERTSASPNLLKRMPLVITIGGDGTLLNASHRVSGKTAMLGVNSSPASSVGFLTGCRAPTFARTLDDLIAGKLVPLTVQRLLVRIGGKRLAEAVLNDVLFCHNNPAMTSRYVLTTPDGRETQKSSGVWISTPAGSTAALRSAGGSPLSLTAKAFAYVVREPYAPPGSALRFVSGVLESHQKLQIESRVPSASIFVDGSHRRTAVHFGDVVTFSLHPRPLLLVRPRS